MYAVGPRPVAYSPPTYDEIVRVVEEAPGTRFSAANGAMIGLSLWFRMLNSASLQRLSRSHSMSSPHGTAHGLQLNYARWLLVIF